MDQGGQKARTVARFEFIGGEVCLDFANTVGGLRGAVAREYLASYDDLVAWSEQADLIDEGEATALLEAAARAPGDAAAVMECACALREAIYGVFSALAAGAPAAAADLEALNVEVEQGMAGAHIIVTTHGYDLAWRKDEQALDQMLGPIARSAAVALTSAERGLVRQCASDTCGWLFVDATKNHRRQWCSMTACGNRARVRRHRQRQRAGGEPGDALVDG